MNGEEQSQPKPVNEGLLGTTRPIKMGQTHCSTNRIWMILAIVFMAISIALAAYLIYVEVSDSSSSSKTTEKEVVARYPGFFRTPEEQVIYARTYENEFDRNVTIVPYEETEKPIAEYCQFSCARPERRKRSQAPSSMVQWLTMYKAVRRIARDTETPLGNPVYHACCISRHKFISPSTAKDRNNVDVTIVQFEDRNQYFSTWECRHAQDCNGCTCLQERHLITAVIRNRDFPDSSDDEFVVDFIVIQGCCKCYNIVP